MEESKQSLFDSSVSEFLKLLNQSTDKSVQIEDYQKWIRLYLPHVASQPMGECHMRLWDWFERLERGIKPLPRIEVWARGHAKSSSAEMGTAYVGCKLSRRFVLYVSATQDQADQHVQNIADNFGYVGLEPGVTRTGTNKGWRRNQLRTSNDFNVAAFGLDGSPRGVKLGSYRPDLIVLDDVDDLHDTPDTIARKIGIITSSILPAGSADCAVLFIQNLIHEDSIVNQLIDGRARFLINREVPEIEPAVIGLKFETVVDEKGSSSYKITDGVATWEGQNLQTCEAQLNEWGERAFLREAQHEVLGQNGYFFNHFAFKQATGEIPEFTKICRAWDLAGTQGGGDYTVGVLMGITATRVCYVLDVKRDQLSPDNVRKLVLETAGNDRTMWGNVKIHIPQDPAQAGKDQAQQYRILLEDYDIRTETVSGKKAKRADGWADRVNSGNAYLLPGNWNAYFIEEHRKFREDEEHDFDDVVDASSDCVNEILPHGTPKSTRPQNTKMSHEDPNSSNTPTSGAIIDCNGGLIVPKPAKAGMFRRLLSM